MPNPQPVWRKSRRSQGTGGCVEVADNLPGIVLVRDSKDQTGPTLTFEPAAWRSFVSADRMAGRRPGR